MSQTEVLGTMEVGVSGQLANLWTEQNGQVASKTSEEASAEIPFGVMVQQGTDDDDVKLLSAQANKLVGISVLELNFAKPTHLGDTGLKPGVTFSVLEKGNILVKPETAVTPASEVHVRAIAAGAEVAGAFRATADGTDTIDITAFARWKTSADAAEIAELEIDMSNAALAVADV